MVLNWGDFPLPGDIWQYLKTLWVFPGGSNGKKNLSANAGDMRDVGLIPGREDPLEEGMETHSSIVAWRIPWTKEPGGLQSTGSQRVRSD